LGGGDGGLKGFQERHEIPDGKDVMLHEAAQVLDSFHGVVNRMGCELGFQRLQGGGYGQCVTGHKGDRMATGAGFGEPEIAIMTNCLKTPETDKINAVLPGLGRAEARAFG
jgi:hypothetical protein